jgi:predicted nucleic acid-binding protein
MSAYADTNFLARLYLMQSENSEAIELASTVSKRLIEPLPITWLLQIELASALELYVFFGKNPPHPRITPEQAAVAHADFQSDLVDGLVYRMADLDSRLLTRRAAELTIRHTAKFGCRAYDLIHVASALELGCTEFWTFDKRAAALAEREGMKVPAKLKAAARKSAG